MSLFRTKAIETDLEKSTGLKRTLNAFDLTMLGVGAIIGAGIFVLTGKTAANAAGPAVVLSFIVAGIACACAALSYAEMASSVGGAGSAYGYGYATLGELPAWIIFWMLLCEYTVAVSAVSVGWSGYFNAGIQSAGHWMMAHWGFGETLAAGIPEALRAGPFDARHPGLINLPAAAIIVILGTLLVTGAKTSARFNTAIVFVKLAAIALFIGVALFHIDPANWSPFIPPAEAIPGASGGFSWEMPLLDTLLPGGDTAMRYGLPGIFVGASTIFFAYLGFDAVSTSAEETKNPQKALPIGILVSLFLCTAIYIVVSGLLTGLVSYRELNVDAPVAYALQKIGKDWAAGLISVGAIAGLTTVMLVMYYAQTRVLVAVSRDGLLPGFMQRIDGRSGSPVPAIVLSGIAMTLLGGFVPLNQLGELANIGTLGAFTVVCIGVIVLRARQPALPRPFRVPLYPFVPLLGTVACTLLLLNLAVFTWAAFGTWMLFGLTFYFLYSRRNSRLAAST